MVPEGAERVRVLAEGLIELDDEANGGSVDDELFVAAGPSLTRFRLTSRLVTT